MTDQSKQTAKGSILSVLSAFIVAGGLQYFEPVFDRLTGAAVEEKKELRKELKASIDSLASEQTWHDSLMLVELEYLHEMYEAGKHSKKGKTFAVGPRADSAGNMYYVAFDGDIHEMIKDDFHWWFKYSDPSDWQSPHKAIFTEENYSDFEERQAMLFESVMYYETIRTE